MDLENSNCFLINELNSNSELKFQARNYKVKETLSNTIVITPDMNLLTRKIINGLDFSSDAFHELCIEHAIPTSIEQEAQTLNNNDIIKYIAINAIANEASKLNNKYMDIFYKYSLDSKHFDPEYFFTRLFYRYFLGFEYLPIAMRNKQKKNDMLIKKANELEIYLKNALTNVLTKYGFECTPTSQSKNIEVDTAKRIIFSSLSNEETIQLNIYDKIHQSLLDFSKTKENYFKPSATPREQLRIDVCEMHSAKLVSESTGIALDYLYKMINGQKPITTKNLAKIYSSFFINNPSDGYNYIYYISGEENQRKINRLYFKATELISSEIINTDIPIEKLANNCLYNPEYNRTSVTINDVNYNNVFGIKYNYAPLLDALELLGNRFYKNKLPTGIDLTADLFEKLLGDIKTIKKTVLSEYKELIKASTTTYYDVSSKDGTITITRNTNQVKKFIKLI